MERIPLTTGFLTSCSKREKLSSTCWVPLASFCSIVSFPTNKYFQDREGIGEGSTTITSSRISFDSLNRTFFVFGSSGGISSSPFLSQEEIQENESIVEV
ncbi:hypothetical protein E1A91_D05G339900v1 [Gossypium mustelinum]|uniref:Uncharacterized protein n=1 Tax=Gossypium mustelinum TaxID=34275 RepID=A0A5D2V499_GOSMU|nr:hypothetical protein E1A91_D05G339900v1 [Gossypium mustelinum]